MMDRIDSANKKTILSKPPQFNTEVIKIMAALTIDLLTLDKGFDILDGVIGEVFAETELLS